MRLFVGASGYSYRHWYGVFYPEELPRYRMLEFYSQHFNTVELNVTFYRVPKETTFKGWYKRTPESFVFSIKANRTLTHIKRLNCTENEIGEFLNAIAPLKEKASVVLWQLPPSFKKNLERLENLLQILKRYKPVRHAFEFRHESWLDEEIFKLLKDSSSTLCFTDWPINSKVDFEFDFYYLRRHGAFEDAPFSRAYTQSEIEKDAKLIAKKIKDHKDVYIYYNNDTEGFAIKNAFELKEAVSRLCEGLV